MNKFIGFLSSILLIFVLLFSNSITIVKGQVLGYPDPNNIKYYLTGSCIFNYYFPLPWDDLTFDHSSITQTTRLNSDENGYIYKVSFSVPSPYSNITVAIKDVNDEIIIDATIDLTTICLTYPESTTPSTIEIYGTGSFHREFSGFFTVPELIIPIVDFQCSIPIYNISCKVETFTPNDYFGIHSYRLTFLFGAPPLSIGYSYQKNGFTLNLQSQSNPPFIHQVNVVSLVQVPDIDPGLTVYSAIHTSYTQFSFMESAISPQTNFGIWAQLILGSYSPISKTFVGKSYYDTLFRKLLCGIGEFTPNVNMTVGIVYFTNGFVLNTVLNSFDPPALDIPIFYSQVIQNSILDIDLINWDFENRYLRTIIKIKNFYLGDGVARDYQLIFPYGFTTDTGDSLLLTFSWVVPQNRSKTITTATCLQKFGVQSCSSTQTNVKSGGDTEPPKLLELIFQEINADITKVIISVSDNEGVYKINGNFLNGDVKLPSLISGSQKNGDYLTQITTKIQPLFLEIFIYDINGNVAKYDSNTPYISSKMTHLPKLPLYANGYVPPISPLDLLDFTFATYGIDTCNGSNNFYRNSLTFKYANNQPGEVYPSIYLYTGYNTTLQKYTGGYDGAQSRYQIDFLIPAYLEPGSINYQLYMPPYKLESYDLYQFLNSNAILSTTCSGYFNQLPPLVSSITLLNTTGIEIPNGEIHLLMSNPVYYAITIDSPRFLKGYIHIKGSHDSFGFKKNFTLSDLTDEILNLQILFPQDTMLQYYYIDYMELEDTLGHISSSTDYFIDPLSRVQFYQIINITGTAFSGVASIPFLKTFHLSGDISGGTLNVFVANIITVTFSYFCSNNCSYVNLPTVYAETIDRETIQSMSLTFLGNVSSKEPKYSADLIIPPGFAYPHPIAFSIFGIADSTTVFVGYSSNDIESTTSNSSILNTAFNFISSISNQSLEYTNTDNVTISITVEGYGYDVHPELIKLYIKFPSNVTTAFSSSTFLEFSGTLIRVEFPAPSVYGIYQVYVASAISTLTSNTVELETISPVTPPPVTDPPITDPPITTSPPTCVTDCGITEGRGMCDISTLLCNCTLPWMGDDCGSKPIIIEKPIPSISTPDITIIIPFTNESTSTTTTTGNSQHPTNSEEELIKIEYKTFIGIHSIREISGIDDQIIKNHTFSEWIYEATNDSSIYRTKIFNTSEVSVTVQWFEKATMIDFAHTNISLTDSSIKYSIKVSNHTFSSRLNYLQFIMLATIEQNQVEDSCSQLKFENHKEKNYQSIKLTVNDHTLYGKFLTRGQFDNVDKILDVSHKIINDSSLPSSNSKLSTVGIGINIPHFDDYALLDPDFSVLLNSKPIVEDDNDAICTSSDVSDSGGLSKGALAGIILSCVLVFTGVTIITLHHIRNKYRYHHRMISLTKFAF